MDRFNNTRIEKQTIYEIFRACRLCGAGGGYKMPIIQNVVGLDDSDAELRQKIRECVQIEVHQDDKMPPLICELCVDKVNDFYEFLEMCRQTNKQTRLRLGLPPQTLPRGVADADECILGVTEPVYVNNDSKLKSKAFKSGSKAGFKKEHPHVTKADRETISQHGRGPGPASKLRRARRTPSPEVPATRSSRARRDDVVLARLVKGDKKSPRLAKITPKKQIKEQPVVRPKRQHEPDTRKSAMPSKRVKLTPKAAPVKTPPKSEAVCKICSQEFMTNQALGKHMTMHTVRYTSVELACNACGEWWASGELAAAHHRRHKPYRCRHCHARYTTHRAYNEHFARKPCSPWEGAPDVVCARCQRGFPTAPLRDRHRCAGEQARPGGKCSKCGRTYSLLRNLQKHESLCTAGRKRAKRHRLEAQMKPLRVSVARCDPLLQRTRGDHYDVADVPHNYGLDPNTVYPYLTSVRIKSESSINMRDGMVQIKGDLDDLDLDYVHWDSSSESETESLSLIAGPERNRNIPSLTMLSLKTLFSSKCLGKVRRKRRKIKYEKELMFDSILNTTEVDNTITRDINHIIDNLGDDDDDNVNATTNDMFNDTADTDSWDDGNNRNDTLVDIDKIFDSLKDDNEVADDAKIQESDSPQIDGKEKNITPEQNNETVVLDNEANSSEKNTDENVAESSKNDDMNEEENAERISNDYSKVVVENEHVSQTKPDDAKTQESDSPKIDGKETNFTPEQNNETVVPDNEANSSEKNTDGNVTESSKNDDTNEEENTEQISNDDSKVVVENEHISQTKPDDAKTQESDSPKIDGKETNFTPEQNNETVVPDNEANSSEKNTDGNVTESSKNDDTNEEENTEQISNDDSKVVVENEHVSQTKPDDAKTQESDSPQIDGKQTNTTPEQNNETVVPDNKDGNVTESSKNDDMNEEENTEQISNYDSKVVVENEHVSQTKPDHETKMDEQKTNASNVENGEDDTKTDTETEDKVSEEFTTVLLAR